MHLFQVCPVEGDVVAATAGQTVDVRGERGGDGDAHVVRAVVEPLQQVGVHGVQLVAAQGAAGGDEDAAHTAAREEARRLRGVVKGGPQLGQQVGADGEQLRVRGGGVRRGVGRGGGERRRVG